MLVVIVLLILILLFIILNKKTEVFKNFRRIDPYIYNKLETMGDDEKIIDLDKILPKNIKIVNIRRKGKGIILLKNVKKGNVIYFVPIKYYNDDFSVYLHSKKSNYLLFKGDFKNIKLTTKEDLKIARYYLDER